MISVPAFRYTFGYVSLRSTLPRPETGGGGGRSIANTGTRYILKGEPVVPASWQSGFNSISSVGQFFGGFLCSWISDRIGRRYSLLAGLCFVTGGIFGEVFSTTKPAFLIGKMILGVGLGFYLTIGPLYCSEVAPMVLRGMITGGINFAIVIGQLLANAVIKGFGDRTDTWAYRGPFAIQWLFVGRSSARVIRPLRLIISGQSSSWSEFRLRQSRPGTTSVAAAWKMPDEASSAFMAVGLMSHQNWP
jgi:MFS family permease